MRRQRPTPENIDEQTAAAALYPPRSSKPPGCSSAILEIVPVASAQQWATIRGEEEWPGFGFEGQGDL
jgi:hypothetical protein